MCGHYNQRVQHTSSGRVALPTSETGQKATGFASSRGKSNFLVGMAVNSVRACTIAGADQRFLCGWSIKSCISPCLVAVRLCGPARARQFLAAGDGAPYSASDPVAVPWTPPVLKTLCAPWRRCHARLLRQLATARHLTLHPRAARAHRPGGMAVKSGFPITFTTGRLLLTAWEGNLLPPSGWPATAMQGGRANAEA